jgi:hypothetical protein
LIIKLENNNYLNKIHLVGFQKMLIVERKFCTTKIVNIFFPQAPVTNLPDYDILTYFSYKNWGEIKGFEKVQDFTTTIDLSQDLDVIWNKIKRQHKRHIQRAETDGTKVTISNNFRAFQKFYKEFLKQKNYADPFGLNIVTSEFMKKYGVLFLAENQSEILGGNLYFHDDYNTLSIYIAYQLDRNSNGKKRRIYDGNCIIHWEAIRYFKNLGFTNYDLGAVNYFTRSFGGEDISLYAYRKFNSRYHKLLFQAWNLLFKGGFNQ